MANKKNVLILRVDSPKYDAAAKYAFFWAERIKEEAESLGFYVIDLKNEDVEENRIKRLIEEYDPFLIFLSGHGSGDSFKGYDGKTDIILRCKNDHLFKDRIVYACSCETATILGKSAFTKGCKCYIGYNKKFIFPVSNLENTKREEILSDFIAEPFMKASNEIILTFLKGGNPEEAYLNSQNLFDNLINYWNKQVIPEALQMVKYLKQAKNAQYMHI